MKFFEDKKVIAFIGDGKMDFQPADFDSALSPEQQSYLKQECAQDISQVFWRRQVHGDEILVAKGQASSCQGAPDADAYISIEKNLPIAIRTADCVPVLLHDPIKHAIGVVHAGWKGTRKEITYKTALRMKEVFDCHMEDIHAVLGPAIQSCCYEVGEEFRQFFPKDIMERSGKLYVDVTKNNLEQLLRAGIKKEHITNTGICTHCHREYPSFRRDADKSGRMISLMMLL